MVPSTGLHIRLKNKAYKLPGEGKNHISRIHLDDLAKLIFCSIQKGRKNHQFMLQGDLCPAQQVEVVRFLCDKLNLPMPESMPIGEAHSTVRGDRQVVSQKILNDLGVYPFLSDLQRRIRRVFEDDHYLILRRRAVKWYFVGQVYLQG